MRFLFLVVSFISLLGCSFFPPKPPEPKGKITPINVLMEKNGYQHQENNTDKVVEVKNVKK